MKFKHTTPVLIAIVLTLSSLAAKAQTAMTLDQAIEYARNHNVEVQNSKLEIQVSQKEVKSIVSTGLPQINASGQFLHNVQIAAQQFPDFISPAVYGVLIQEGLLPASSFKAGQPQTVQFGAPAMMVGMVTLNQLLFDGTYFLGLNAAKEYVELSKLMSGKTEIDVTERVSKAYYLAVLSDHNLGLLKESLATIEKTYDETKAMYEAGIAEQLDVDRLDFAKTNLSNQVKNTEYQKNMSLQMLKLTMGMNINEPLTLTQDIDALSSAATVINATQADYNNRIEYKILEEQLTLDSLNIKRYKVGYIPKLTLSATHQRNSFASSESLTGLGKTWNPGTSYSLNLSVPIFDGLYKKAKTDQARVKMLQDQNTMENFKNSVDLEIQNAIANYEMQLNNLETQKKNRALARSIFDKSKIKFNEGVGSSFELIQAENDLNTAEINYTNTLYSLLVAQLELKKAIGELK